MKFLFLSVINFYQKILSVILKNLLGASKSCRFSVSCSEYARRSIVKYGVLKGSLLSTRRILKCQPFYK